MSLVILLNFLQVMAHMENDPVDTQEKKQTEDFRPRSSSYPGHLCLHQEIWGSYVGPFVTQKYQCQGVLIKGRSNYIEAIKSN